jgi:HK97 family phage major capsid protein
MKFKDFLKTKGLDETSFASKEANEQGSLMSEFNDINANKHSEELESIKAKNSELENAMKAQGEALAELKVSKANSNEYVNPTVKALTENLEGLKSLQNKDTKQLNITVKSVGTITTGNVTPTTAGGISTLLNDADLSISRFARSRPFFTALFPTTGTTGATVSYAEMATPEGGAGMTAEGALKSQADFNLVEKVVNIKKVTAYIKTSKEALSVIPALAGEIDNVLTTLVELKADSQILSGDGTGQNLTGITSVAQAFSAGDFASTIPNPNEYDVINVAVNQIEIAEVISGEPSGFMPNVIALNPTDIKKMKLAKDANEQYVFPASQLGNVTTVIDEIPVLSNPRIPKGYFLVMDTTKGTIRVRENTNLQIGYENDDFTKNLVTILAEKRLAFYIKSQNVKAFVYDSFATAKSALELI